MISSHLLPRGVFISCSQRSPNHSNNAINNDAIAYTSASTALNQKLSVKVKASAPTAELPITIKALLLLNSENFSTKALSIMVNDQNIKSMVNALEATDTMLTIRASLSGPDANIAKKAPTIWNNGAPGG